MARRLLARRVLASFAVVVVAFAATVGAGLTAQRQAARDVADLSVGYLPLETALARARAACRCAVSPAPTVAANATTTTAKEARTRRASRRRAMNQSSARAISVARS